MLNRKKQGIIIPKSYVVANAIIRAKKHDNRMIVDNEDVERMESLVKFRLDTLGNSVSFLDDFKSDLYDDEFIYGKVGDVEFFMSLPGSSVEDLAKYRTDLPFGLEKVFKELDDDSNFERNQTDLILLKTYEDKICSEYDNIPEIKKPKKVYKKQHVSEK